MIIGARFNGPPGSANGGYAAALFAAGLFATSGSIRPATEPILAVPAVPVQLGTKVRSGEKVRIGEKVRLGETGDPVLPGASAEVDAASLMGRTATVTLRLPPPLETPLVVQRAAGRFPASGLRVLGPSGALVAEAVPAESGPGALSRAEVVAPASWAEAAEVSASYPGFTNHPFPTCFVCGPARDPDDGLRLFPGPLSDGRSAAGWLVPDEVSPALVWAALDCPGGWALPLQDRPYLLGRITAEVFAVPAPGSRCVVVGRMTSEDGRKAHVLTTLHGPDGRALGRARATWLAIKTG